MHWLEGADRNLEDRFDAVYAQKIKYGCLELIRDLLHDLLERRQVGARIPEVKHPSDYPGEGKKIDVDTVLLHLAIDFIEVDLHILAQLKAHGFYTRLFVHLFEPEFIAVE